MLSDYIRRGGMAKDAGFAIVRSPNVGVILRGTRPGNGEETLIFRKHSASS
jgi:hypothetical protein